MRLASTEAERSFSFPRSPFGTVTEGARADLLIVAANPLENLTTLRSPLAVVRLGHFHAAQWLDSVRVSGGRAN